MLSAKALLLTDVVDSTRLNEQLGDTAMSALWSQHDRIARDLLAAWRGREIDKTDGMLLLFDAVSDAVEYSLAFHRALAARQLPIQVRAGIHFAEVALRHNELADVTRGAKPLEVIGLALPMTARIMSIALGSQTLLSASACSAFAPGPHRVKSHGYWRLQGMAEPAEVFEVGDAETHFQPPKENAKAYQVTRLGTLWQPTRQISHSLPAERDGFVGRRDALSALRASIESARLVSILGIGGTGKTRLAVRHAWECLGEYPGGAWFCDLSQARTLDGIAFAVAQGLQVPLGPADPIQQIAQAIAGRDRCLVLLDNFEQVARHAEPTLGCWIERAPQAKFVVTTREVLGIVGESVMPLAPLSSNDAAELFVQRAAAARLGYTPSAADTDAIWQIARLLDNLPLALELAAARVRLIPPSVLVSRMRDRFELISARAGRRDRQSTLRATFDWSWDLLHPGEKAALATLSVFEGGFTLDSASAVLAGDDETPRPGIETIQALADKSLVRRVSDERFDLLETVREYAGQRLGAEGGFPGSGASGAASARARHWRYFAHLNERDATAHRCIEVNNLVAACRAATAAAAAPAAATCLAVAWSALRLTGPYRVAVELALAISKLPSLQDRERALALWVASDALELSGDIERARQYLQQGLACVALAQAPEIEARLLITLGNRQTLDGELNAARATLEQSLRLAQQLGDADLQMRCLNALGLHSDHQAQLAEAQDFYRRALALARELGDRRMEGGLLGNLGGPYHDMGDLDAAQVHYEMALQVATEVGDHRWEGNARCNLGLLHQEQGRAAEARSQFETAMAIARRVGHIRLEYTVLCNLGILLAGEGQLVDAGRHFERAVELAVACADRRAEGQFRGYLAVNQARRGLLALARESLVTGESLLLAMSDRFSHALLLCDRAEVESIGQRSAAARTALDKACRIADELRCHAESELCRRIAGVEALIPRHA
jgi:predicted ATPase/class 3 adenylate cyclase/tetratricopeptide (TPR) repeat protein